VVSEAAGVVPGVAAETAVPADPATMAAVPGRPATVAMSAGRAMTAATRRRERRDEVALVSVGRAELRLTALPPDREDDAGNPQPTEYGQEDHY
jgi:hypothetical protein